MGRWSKDTPDHLTKDHLTIRPFTVAAPRRVRPFRAPHRRPAGLPPSPGSLWGWPTTPVHSLLCLGFLKNPHNTALIIPQICNFGQLPKCSDAALDLRIDFGLSPLMTPAPMTTTSAVACTIMLPGILHLLVSRHHGHSWRDRWPEPGPYMRLHSPMIFTRTRFLRRPSNSP